MASIGASRGSSGILVYTALTAPYPACGCGGPGYVHGPGDIRYVRVGNMAKRAALAKGVPLHVFERFLRDKESDPLGRPIPDNSHSAHGTPPNHDDLKPIIAQRWGDVTHPDISDVARAIIVARATTHADRIWGSRVDVKAAYTRIPLDPRDAPMLATLMTVDHPKYGTLVSIPIVNQWGAQIAGHAYEVLGRALSRRADARTATEQGRTGVTYVDDRIQFGSRQLIMAEVDDFSTDARAAMGIAVINDTKTVTSTRLDTIGWRCDTIRATVSPSPRAVLKLIYVFSVLTGPDVVTGVPNHSATPAEAEFACDPILKGDCTPQTFLCCVRQELRRDQRRKIDHQTSQSSRVR